MRITVIGGGPGGLYFALLTKKQRPDWSIDIYEQNQAEDTFGFGVVFSDETLHEFLSRDRPSFDRIRHEFAYWDDVAIHKDGRDMRCAGNGFAGISRMKLLAILQQRCREEGIGLHFGVSVPPEELATCFADSDVIVAADACFTFDQTDLSGRLWAAEDVHALSLSNLAMDYARVFQTSEILASH